MHFIYKGFARGETCAAPMREGNCQMANAVILGGNECMECRYKDVCKKFGFKAKVFPKMKRDIGRKIGSPDLIVLFTNTASHQLAMHAAEEAKRSNAKIVYCHNASMAALQSVLEEHTGSVA